MANTNTSIMIPGVDRQGADQINQILRDSFVEAKVQVVAEAEAGPCETACSLAAAVGRKKCMKLPFPLNQACLFAVGIAEDKCKDLCDLGV